MNGEGPREACSPFCFGGKRDGLTLLRKTKIVATLGPVSSSEEMLARMIVAGVDVVRLNFSHGTAEDHMARADMVRRIATRIGRPVGVLCDLQGPKIRIGKFA